jgi:hypothetical protein
LISILTFDFQSLPSLPLKQRQHQDIADTLSGIRLFCSSRCCRCVVIALLFSRRHQSFAIAASKWFYWGLHFAWYAGLVFGALDVEQDELSISFSAR